jgi:hypothetical protein
MRSTIYIFAIVIAMLGVSTSVFGDVKIKTKQTMSGQSYENITFIKGKRSRTEVMNGMMINVTQCDMRRGIQINPNARTYIVNDFAVQVQPAGQPVSSVGKDSTVAAGGKVETTITTKDTGERKQMFGFTARHLIITMETKSSPDSCTPSNSKIQTDGWYIDAEFVLDCDQNYQSFSANAYANKSGCRDKYEIKTVGTAKRGYPVYEKMTMFDAAGKETMSMVNEVVEISKTALDPSLFEAPQDYRLVNDISQMYAVNSSPKTSSASAQDYNIEAAQPLPLAASVNRLSQGSSAEIQPVGPKRAGVTRIGLVTVKTGAVGEGVAAADLSAAIQNSLTEYLRSPGVEVVNITSKLSSAITAEAKEKDCDFVLVATASHKRGGGGLGMFGQAFGSAIGATGFGATGSTAGNIAGQVATRTVVSATTLSANVKPKDEITLEIGLQPLAGPGIPLKQYKVKAKSVGDDIISQVVEQAAQGIVSTIGK